jgi:hypothetical protein
MRKYVLVLVCAALALAPAGAVGQEKRVSPHDKASATIAGQTITIEYGRPYVKGRTIFGGLVPWGQVWRTGADEATKLTTTGDIMLAGIHVPKGSYSLFTIPGEKEWTLVVNKVASQWGAYKYEQSQDLGRAAMKVSKSAQPVEQLTIAIEPGSGNRGTLRIAWANTVATAPIMIH